LIIEALRALRVAGEDGPLDLDGAPIPSAPFDVLPELFERAGSTAFVESGAGRDAAIAELAADYPDIAGVVILQDTKDPVIGEPKSRVQKARPFLHRFCAVALPSSD
jgi:hypothetical protein